MMIDALSVGFGVVVTLATEAAFLWLLIRWANDPEVVAAHARYEHDRSAEAAREWAE